MARPADAAFMDQNPRHHAGSPLVAVGLSAAAAAGRHQEPGATSPSSRVGRRTHRMVARLVAEEGHSGADPVARQGMVADRAVEPLLAGPGRVAHPGRGCRLNRFSLVGVHVRHHSVVSPLRCIRDLNTPPRSSAATSSRGWPRPAGGPQRHRTPRMNAGRPCFADSGTRPRRRGRGWR